jgi:hypothetical protein
LLTKVFINCSFYLGMTVLDDIENIWRNNSIEPRSNPRINPNDDASTEIVARDPVRSVLWHGNYCGPGTSGKLNVPPADALDFACKLHDTYYGYPKADNALAETATYLLQNNMINGKQVTWYAKMMDSSMFFAGSFCWKNIFQIILIILAALFILAFLAFTAAFKC